MCFFLLILPVRDPQGGMRGLETCLGARFLEDGMGAGMQVPCLGPEVCPVHSADSQDLSHPVLPDAFDSLPVLSFLFTAQVGEDTGPDITGRAQAPRTAQCTSIPSPRLPFRFLIPSPLRSFPRPLGSSGARQWQTHDEPRQK